ncbi:MAG TPA: ferrochelatase [Bacteroidales bacterium]|nr:ferrochelatase [Bacteroidales bacterium]
MSENQKQKRIVLLVNVGTPDKPKVREVRKYLTPFLNDRRVIDIPWLLRKILVNLIIIPFRVRNSTNLYKRLWTNDGSPLLIYLNSLVDKLQKLMDKNTVVKGVMRYGNPSMKKALEEMKHGGFTEIVVFPLYPQYASSTTGSVHELLMNEVRKWEVIPKVRLIDQYYRNNDFLNAFAYRIRAYKPQEYDHVVFSYHGLPTRQIDKVHPGIKENQCSCETGMPAHGDYCYKAACYETTRLLADKLALDSGNYSVSFQSRLSKNWLKPFTDENLEKLAKEGKKRILIVAPAFVADCLETTIELGYEYKELFEENGGEELTLVESLNDSDEWAKAIVKILD